MFSSMLLGITVSSSIIDDSPFVVGSELLNVIFLIVNFFLLKMIVPDNKRPFAFLGSNEIDKSSWLQKAHWSIFTVYFLLISLKVKLPRYSGNI
jgi:hypothetical protein